jgi:hypothetical protein
MGHRMLISALIAAAAGFAAIDTTAAQPDPDHDIKTMNFDLWCQEEAALPAARCDKRTPEDESSFEAHLASLERYEIPYRSAQYDQARVNRDIMNNDPIDNPHKDDLGVQDQYPNLPVRGAQSNSIPAP